MMIKRLPRRFILPTIFILCLIAGVVWIINLHPSIDDIPIVPTNGEVAIEGRGFYHNQGFGEVLLVVEGNADVPIEVKSWSNHEILVQLPDGLETGSLKVSQRTILGQKESDPYQLVFQASGLPSKPYGYEVPVQDDAPWTTFRHDQDNTGRSSIVASYSGDQPWSVSTGKGIFSTPIIDGQGVIYIGSADHYFYAINPDGTIKWKFRTGEIIDSAGALGRFETRSNYATVTFISGDGFMYHLRTDDNVKDTDGDGNANERLLWKFEAKLRPEVSFNRWFEGNVAVGYDGTLYAGNTNFYYYAINPDGSLKWTYPTGSNNWSQAAFGKDGTIFWGSNDTYIRAVDSKGHELWKRMTLGFIAASAAIGSDGTVYIGSFDSNLYALEPKTGKILWKFPTGEHIYASVALGANSSGKTTGIYFGSADGTFYALKPNGTLMWKFEPGDPIRSSAVINLDAQGNEIVYFGCGNGKLYALNAKDGSLRWAFDTTPEEPELQDRNDLNGSPALGLHGIYIGGEHGNVWFIPYDYCLNSTSNPRCDTGNGGSISGELNIDKLPDQMAGLYYVTSGGNTKAEFPAELPSATQITLRLIVRENGELSNAHVCNLPIGCPKDGTRISVTPQFPFQTDHSADGRYIIIRPDGFLNSGTIYRMDVISNYYRGGLRIGNMTIGGSYTGTVKQSFEFQIQNAGEGPISLEVTADKTSAFEWTRLAAPLPPMLPSLNQIGFDYLDWIVGTVAISPTVEINQGKIVLWAIGAKRDDQGQLVPDPESKFILPLSGSYNDHAFIVDNHDFSMPITGINIPFNQFQLRGQFDANLVVQPGASAFADTEVLSIPKFGPYLVIAGLANNLYQRLLVSGTYVTRAYSDHGTANLKPQEIMVANLDYQAPTRFQDGHIEVTFHADTQSEEALSNHRLGILLMDSSNLKVVSLNYQEDLSSREGGNGNPPTVTLRIPKGTELPMRLKAYVMMDVFPMYAEELKR